jgi:bacterioferritin-associated ferredoxin
MYVCLCRAVSDTTIAVAIHEGAGTTEEVGIRCGAGTDCGKCRTTIEFMILREREMLVGPSGRENGES